VEQIGDVSFLFNHRCLACKNPIAACYETIGAAIIALDALARGTDVDGDITPLYRPACLFDALELAYPDGRLRLLGEALQEIDMLLGKATP